MTSGFLYTLLFIDILLTVSAQLSLRVGAQRLNITNITPSIILEPLHNWHLTLGMILYAISFFLYVFILSKLQLSIVYPVAVGSMLVLITAASYFFLKESITSIHLVGIGAILIGVILILLPK